MADVATPTAGLLRSMSIIAGSQSVTIVLGIVRVKVLAVLLGPAGVGVLGLYTAILQTGSTLSGLGIGSSGVRQIASSNSDPEELARVRRVLLTANVLQGLLGMAVIWTFREWLALAILSDATRARDVGLIGIAVLLTLIAGSQTALLRGMRRIGDLARVSVYSGLIGTLVAILAVWQLGMDGLIWFLMVLPFANVLIAVIYTRRLPRVHGVRITLRQAWQQWRQMASLGMAFMASGLMAVGTLLLVRAMIAADLGLEATGQFQAAWTVTMQYVGFLLAAMAADYYPRLTATITDRDAATALVNDQILLGAAIGGPILLAMIGLAPWVMKVLYSAEFSEAVLILQLQTVGNVLKLAVWPMAFILVAGARSGLFFLVELTWNVAFLALIWVGLPVFGLEVTGGAFAIAYLAYFALVHLVVRRVHGFRWQGETLRLVAMHAALSLGILLLALSNAAAGGVVAVLAAIVTGVFGLRLIVARVGTESRLAGRIAGVFDGIGWSTGKSDAR